MDAAKRERARLLFQRYGNRSGDSGVSGYALTGDGIAVKFANGAVYLYDRGCPGRLHVTRMKQLAREGSGLATYISRRVGHRYAMRLDEGAPRPARRSHAQSSTRQNTALR